MAAWSILTKKAAPRAVSARDLRGNGFTTSRRIDVDWQPVSRLLKVNNCILIGLLLSTASVAGWSGCAKAPARNSALFGGGTSALTMANSESVGEKGNAAMGSVPADKPPSTTDRLLSPLRSVKKTFTPQPVKGDALPDPISLANMPNKPTPELFLSAARVIATSGNHESAQSLYEQALIADPSNRDALLELARIYVHQGEQEKAREVYLKAVEVHPQDPIVFNDLGLFHLEAEDPELGIKAFQRAVQLDPERNLYRNNLANAYVITNRADLALDQLLAVEAKPVAHYNLGYLLYSHRRLVPAIEQFDMAFQEDDRFYDAHVMKTRLLEEVAKEKEHNPESYVRPVNYTEDSGDSDLERNDPRQTDSHKQRVVTERSIPKSQSTPPLKRHPAARASQRIGNKPVIERTPEKAPRISDNTQARATNEPSTRESSDESAATPRIFSLSDREAAEVQPLTNATKPTSQIKQVGFSEVQTTGTEVEAESSSLKLANYEVPVETPTESHDAQLASLTMPVPTQGATLEDFPWADRIWNHPQEPDAQQTERVGEMSYPVTDAPRLLGAPQVDARIDERSGAVPTIRLPSMNLQETSAELDSRMLISPSQYLRSQSAER